MVPSVCCVDGSFAMDLFDVIFGLVIAIVQLVLFFV